MSTLELVGWARPAVDAALVLLLALVLRRLGDDPAAPWRERETALRTIFDDLRAAIAQAEGLARDLDDKLAERATEIRGLLAEHVRAADRVGASAPTRTSAPEGHTSDDIAATTALADLPFASTRASDERRRAGDAAAAAARASDPAELATRVRALAAAAMPVEDIARRLDVPAAEVRLLIGIDAAAARAGSAAAGAAAGRQ